MIYTQAYYTQLYNNKVSKAERCAATNNCLYTEYVFLSSFFTDLTAQSHRKVVYMYIANATVNTRI